MSAGSGLTDQGVGGPRTRRAGDLANRRREAEACRCGV